MSTQSLVEHTSIQLLEGLNPEQRTAVTAIDGPVLVVAGPGSGKTRVLTVRVAYLIQESGVAPWNILAVTFTNKAAREMRERIEALVGERARWITIGTFHSFCARTLRTYGQEIGIDPRFVIYDDSDQLAIAKQALESLDINTRQFSPRSILGQISRAKSSGLSPEEFRDVAETYYEEIVARVYPVYQDILARRRALDFDDLLHQTVRLFASAPATAEALRQRHRYVLVDEYQDTNRIQYDLIRELCATHRNLCVVGDPDQSIYGWRAADIRNILNFRRDYPDAIEVHLEELSLDSQILSAADGVIRENVQRIDRALRTSNPGGAAIAIREAFDDEHEARIVVEEVSRLLTSGERRGADIAVLYRTNAQSRPIEEMFIRAGIAYQLIGGTRFYERKEVRDALAMLRLISNPNDTSAFERVVAEFPIGAGIGKRSIDELERWGAARGVGLGEALNAVGRPSGPPLASRGQKLAAGFNSELSGLREIAEGSTLTDLFDAAMEQTGYRRLYESGDPLLGERWENVLQLRGHMEVYDELPQDERLTTFLEEVALVSDADTIEEDRDCVTLITLHAVKGLEFAVVFITGVEDGLIPHHRTITERPEMLEEERRLFYVGITRAKERLYLTYALRRNRFGSFAESAPSFFLSSIPADSIETPTSRATTRRLLESRQAAPTPPAMDAVAPRVRAGQSVFHSRYGEGLVVAVIEQRDDQEVTVDFKRHGEKRMLASMAKLTLVDGTDGNDT